MLELLRCLLDVSAHPLHVYRYVHLEVSVGVRLHQPRRPGVARLSREVGQPLHRG